MHDPIYYHDGYTRKFRIQAVRGLHGQLKGEYRPMLYEARAEMLQAIRHKSTSLYTGVIRMLTGQHLVSWDIQDDKGNPVPLHDVKGQITPAAATVIKRMQPALFDKLSDVISGDRPTDPLEDSDEPDSRESEEALAAYLKAEAEGSTPGNVQAEADRKN